MSKDDALYIDEIILHKDKKQAGFITIINILYGCNYCTKTTVSKINK